MAVDLELTQLVRAALPEDAGEFRACAVFDELLDCVRVIARDCSVTELRINKQITILEENHPQLGSYRKYVGFTLKGAKHFCKERGIDVGAPVRLTEMLDAVLAAYPTKLVRLFVDGYARPLVSEQRIDSVDMSRAA